MKAELYKELTIKMINVDYRDYIKMNKNWYEYNVPTGSWWRIDHMSQLSRYLDKRLKELKKENEDLL